MPSPSESRVGSMVSSSVSGSSTSADVVSDSLASDSLASDSPASGRTLIHLPSTQAPLLQVCCAEHSSALLMLAVPSAPHALSPKSPSVAKIINIPRCFLNIFSSLKKIPEISGQINSFGDVNIV